jgi:Ni,Fe-hydrogenase III small subunit
VQEALEVPDDRSACIHATGGEIAEELHKERSWIEPCRGRPQVHSGPVRLQVAGCRRRPQLVMVAIVAVMTAGRGVAVRHG